MEALVTLTDKRAAYNNRFGVMAAGRWSNRQKFAIHLLLQQDVINLAVEKSMSICTFNQQQLSADGTRNTATTPSRFPLYVTCFSSGINNLFSFGKKTQRTFFRS